ncbi:hypothetical protein WCE55_02145 [Luteimonas sp. MJ293]
MGTELIPAQAPDGGTSTDGSPVEPGDDIVVTLPQLRAYIGSGGVPSTFYVDDYPGSDTQAIQSAIDAAAAAGGGRVAFSGREYVIDGPLLDTSRGNAQILFPSIEILPGNQITIELVGPFAPTPVVSVIGNLPVATGGAVLRSTLTGGSGGAMIGGWGPSGSFGNFTNMLAILKNLTLRMPDNPAHSAADLSLVTSAEIDNVVADTGSYYVEGLAEPTTPSSYGIKLPRVNNGARVTVGVINVIGFYTGVLLGEHTAGQEINSWGCKYAVEAPANTHACIIQRLMSVHCPNGIRATGGASYLQVDQFNIEHATSGWWQPGYDVDDANNYLVGNLRWHVVKANSGVDGTFTKNGGGNIACTQLGDNSGGGGAAFPIVANVSTVSSSLFPADAGSYMRLTASGAKTISVLPNATRPLPENAEWHFRNVGPGNVTIAPGSGVAVAPPAGGSLDIPSGGTVTLKRVGADSFDLFGQTVAS